MEIRLSKVQCIKSKKNGKKYLIYTLLCDGDTTINCFIEYSEDVEERLVNLLWENVSDYIKYQLDKENGSFRPYIDL